MKKIPLIIPKKSESIKGPLMSSQKILKCPVNSFLNENLSILFKSLWYIPVMNAIVPPDIPGIISTDPIRTPIR